MHFIELRVYKIAVQLAVELSEAIKIIPSWKATEVGQILRSSSSVPANIAEGQTRQKYPLDQIRFFTISLGSSDETQHHLYLLYKKNFISQTQYAYFSGEYKNLSIRILNFINAIKSIHLKSS